MNAPAKRAGFAYEDKQALVSDIACAGRMLASIKDGMQQIVVNPGDDCGLLIAVHEALAEAYAATRTAYRSAKMVMGDDAAA